MTKRQAQSVGMFSCLIIQFFLSIALTGTVVTARYPGTGEQDSASAHRTFCHVTTIPPKSILDPHRILESTVAIWSMVQAKKQLQQAGGGEVHILVLVDEEELKDADSHPVLARAAQWLPHLRVEPIPKMYAADLESDKETGQQLHGQATVTVLREILAVAYRLFPDVDTFIHTNPDIAMFPETYTWIVGLPSVALSITRTDVFCPENVLCPAPISKTEANPAQVGEDVMKELVGEARRYPQLHPGHDTFVFPATLLPCLLERMPPVFLGFPPLAKTFLTYLLGCSCTLDKDSTMRAYHEPSRTFHLGDGRPSGAAKSEQAARSWRSSTSSALTELNTRVSPVTRKFAFWNNARACPVGDVFDSSPDNAREAGFVEDKSPTKQLSKRGIEEVEVFSFLPAKASDDRGGRHSAARGGSPARSHKDRTRSRPKSRKQRKREQMELTRAAQESIDYDVQGYPVRSFPRWVKPFPCVETRPSGEQKEKPAGILFIKVPKCASTTSAGIAFRIAHHHSSGSFQCRVKAHHQVASKMLSSGRDIEKSFLWTIIRSPEKRALSQIFHFDVSRGGMEPTEANILAKLREIGETMYNYVRVGGEPADPEERTDRRTRRKRVALVLAEYDFIGLVSRLDESLVALKMILGLDVSTILYVSSKSSGGYDDLCYKIVSSFTTPAVQQYLASDEWKEANAHDRLLYAAANRSLDATIDRLGRPRFLEELKEFRALNARAQQTCDHAAVFPCSASGAFQVAKSDRDCYWQDSGCGYSCLDRLRPPPHRSQAVAAWSRALVARHPPVIPPFPPSVHAQKRPSSGPVSGGQQPGGRVDDPPTDCSGRSLPPRIVHVTSAEAASEMPAHRVVEVVAQLWGMLKARDQVEDKCDVVLLLLLEEADVRRSPPHPVVAHSAEWGGSIVVEPRPRRLAQSVVPAKRTAEWSRILKGDMQAPITVVRDVIETARNLYPLAEAYIYTNPDIIPLPNLYADLLARQKMVPVTYLRTSIHCSGISSACPEVVRKTESATPQVLTLAEMEELQREAYRWPQVHLATTAVVIPASSVRCVIAEMSHVFAGFRYSGDRILRALHYCSCEGESGGEPVRVLRNKTIHLGSDRETSAGEDESRQRLNRLNRHVCGEEALEPGSSRWCVAQWAVHDRKRTLKCGDEHVSWKKLQRGIQTDDEVEEDRKQRKTKRLERNKRGTVRAPAIVQQSAVPIRFLFLVGTEGSGHHFFSPIFQKSPSYDLIGSSEELKESLLALQSALWTSKDMGRGLFSYSCADEVEEEYAEDDPGSTDHLVKLFQKVQSAAMKARAEAARKGGSPYSADAKTVTVLPLNALWKAKTSDIGMMSYPKGQGSCRDLQYPDLDVLYYVCGLSGVECSHLVFWRDAFNVITSTVDKRDFMARPQQMKLMQSMLGVIIAQFLAHKRHPHWCWEYGNRSTSAALADAFAWDDRAAFTQGFDSVFSPPAPSAGWASLPQSARPHMLGMLRSTQLLAGLCTREPWPPLERALDDTTPEPEPSDGAGAPVLVWATAALGFLVVVLVVALVATWFAQHRTRAAAVAAAEASKTGFRPFDPVTGDQPLVSPLNRPSSLPGAFRKRTGMGSAHDQLPETPKAGHGKV